MSRPKIILGLIRPQLHVFTKVFIVTQICCDLWVLTFIQIIYYFNSIHTPKLFMDLKSSSATCGRILRENLLSERFAIADRTLVLICIKPSVLEIFFEKVTFEKVS